MRAPQLLPHFTHQASGDRRDITRPLPQWRHGDRDPGNAVVKILTKQPFAHPLLKIAVRGGKHPHVHGDRVCRPHRTHFALLQHPQQAHLKRGRGLANFIQKHRAPVGALEQAGVVFIGPREGAAFVTKQFRLKQCVGHGRAVFDDKRAGSTRAGVVHRTRQQFLAGTRLPQHQHAQIEAGHPFGHLADGVKRAAGCALNAVEIENTARPCQLGMGALTQHGGAGAQLKVKPVGVALQ